MTMRDFTKVSPSVWKSQKFRALGDETDARLAYLYILTSPHASSAGCYDLPEGYASADLSWDIKRYREAIQRLISVGLIEFAEAENTVRITNWVTFNPPTNAKHAMGILSQLRQASSADLKVKTAQEFSRALNEKGFGRDQALSKAIAGFFEAYRKPMPTETETETERETRPDQDREKTETRAQTREASTDAAAPNGAASEPPEEDETDIGPLIAQHSGLQPAVIPNRLLTPLLEGKGQAPPPKFKRSDYDRMF